MWYRDRVWIQYLKNVRATDDRSARFLDNWLKRMVMTREHATTLEIYDLQRYKIIRHKGKVIDMLREKKNTPFIFVACRN